LHSSSRQIVILNVAACTGSTGGLASPTLRLDGNWRTAPALRSGGGIDLSLATNGLIVTGTGHQYVLQYLKYLFTIAGRQSSDGTTFSLTLTSDSGQSSRTLATWSVRTSFGLSGGRRLAARRPVAGPIHLPSCASHNRTVCGGRLISTLKCNTKRHRAQRILPGSGRKGARIPLLAARTVPRTVPTPASLAGADRRPAQPTR
jgi:hypothetical protein